MRCPNCGAEFEADERHGHHVVCSYCSSSIVLDREALRIAGKMAALDLPRGPLQLGSTGSVDGRGFQVIGRVRYGYAAGFWDEWHLLMEDGETAWISQDEDRMLLEELVAEDLEVENVDELTPGDQLTLAGRNFSLRERGEAVQEGAEGQLPFAVTPGERVPFLDLSHTAGSATLELEEDGARLFVGRPIESSELKLDHPYSPETPDTLERERAAGEGDRRRVVKKAGRELALSCQACGGDLGTPEVGADSMDCPSCGTTIDLDCDHLPCPDCGKGIPLRDEQEAERLSCPSCGGVIGREGEKLQLLGHLATSKRPKVPFHLGQRAKLQGVTYHVAAHVRWVEKDEGKRYYANEFLLHSRESGSAWLSMETGHFVLYQDLESGPQVDPKRLKRGRSFSFRDASYKTYECGRVTADWVEGELPWVLSVGDSYQYADAVAPPMILSAEWDRNELSWSWGRYMKRGEVAEAFGIPVARLPRAGGVAPAQPFEQSEFMRRSGPVAAAFALLGLILLIWSSTTGKAVDTGIQLARNDYKDEFVTESFSINESGLHALRFVAPSIDNSWVYLDVALLDSDARPVHEFSAEMSYYHGVEGGESWSEGSRKDTIPFKLGEAGEYRLLVRGEAGTGEVPNNSFTNEFNVRVVLHEGVVLMRYFVLLLLVSLAWVALVYIPRLIFHGKKWGESD